MADSGGPIPPAPAPSWRFELLHPGCVHPTLYATKTAFLLLDSVSVLGLLLLAGRLLRHRWKAARRREERLVALRRRGWGAGDDNDDDDGGGLKGEGVWRRWWRLWRAATGCCSGGRGAGATTRVTIGDLFERLVRVIGRFICPGPRRL